MSSCANCSSARKCVSSRRRPITSPPGGGRVISPQRASSGGPTESMPGSWRRLGSEIPRVDLLGVDQQGVRRGPSRSPPPSVQLYQSLECPGCGDVVEMGPIIAEKCAATIGRAAFLVFPKGESYTEGATTLDDVLDCGHCISCERAGAENVACARTVSCVEPLSPAVALIYR